MRAWRRREFRLKRPVRAQVSSVEFADIACIVQIGAVLYSDFLQHNPKDPQWLNRDRFVLSGGHGTLSKTVACAAVP